MVDLKQETDAEIDDGNEDDKDFLLAFGLRQVTHKYKNS